MGNEPELLIIRPPDARPRPGALHTDNKSVDSHWHFHDVHQILYAFEGALEVESTRGRNLVPRQLAAWIPAGVPHRVSFSGIPWVSVFLTADMVSDAEPRVRTIIVSPLMREMMREALRWPVWPTDLPDSRVRSAFFAAMAALCDEWITHEADLFLPTSTDARLKRALDYTAQRMDLSLAEICRHAGLSVRSLQRHLKTEAGMTWEEFRHRSRLLQAVSLLSETDEPISEIAARCGFDSQSAFAKVFRHEMGEAPRDYRNRVRNPV